MSARMPGRKQLRPLWRGQGGQGPSWPNIDNDMAGRWRQRQQKRAKPSLAKSQGLSFFLDAVTRNVDAENDMKNMLEKRSQSQPISLFQIVQTGAISKSSFAASVCICNMINMINMCLPPRPLESPSRTTAGPKKLRPPQGAKPSPVQSQCTGATPNTSEIHLMLVFLCVFMCYVDVIWCYTICCYLMLSYCFMLL